MEQKVQMWSTTTKSIFMGVLIYSICNVLYSIFDMIESFTGTASMVQGFMSGSYDSGIGFIDIMCYITLAGIVVGYVFYLRGLIDFGKILDLPDANAIKNVRIGVILGIVATVVDFIPLMGWVAGIIIIVAWILMILGFNALKASSTFPPTGRKGASRLFVTMILGLVGAILGFIPLVGGIFEFIISIIVFFMILSGWGAIKNSSPMELA